MHQVQLLNQLRLRRHSQAVSLDQQLQVVDSQVGQQQDQAVNLDQQFRAVSLDQQFQAVSLDQLRVVSSQVVDSQVVSLGQLQLQHLSQNLLVSIKFLSNSSAMSL